MNVKEIMLHHIIVKLLKNKGRKLRAANESVHVTLRRTVTRSMNGFLKSEIMAYRKPWNSIFEVLQRKQKLKSK